MFWLSEFSLKKEKTQPHRTSLSLIRNDTASHLRGQLQHSTQKQSYFV